MSASPPAPDLLTVAQATAELGRSRAAVYALIQQGKLPATRVRTGGHYRVSRADLDRYRSSHHVEPDMLTVTEAAAAIGSQENTLRRALGAGRLHGELVGPRRYIRRGDLDEYAARAAGQYELTVAARAVAHRADLDALHAEGFLTMAEVIERAGVTRGTVQRWITAGKLRSVKRGHLRGIRPEWLDEMRSR